VLLICSSKKKKASDTRITTTTGDGNTTWEANVVVSYMDGWAPDTTEATINPE